MGIPRFLWLSFAHLVFFFATDIVNCTHCMKDQSSALLSLQQTLKFDPLLSSKLVSWNSTTDCCSWKGITCKYGQVIALNLSAEYISGGLDDSSTLFDLQQLESLDLAFNDFSAPIPPAIGRLANLEHLDLSNSGFNGQVPGETSQLTKLISLDLSSSRSPWDNLLELQHPNLTLLVLEFSKLQEIRLDGINISNLGSEWSNVLSSSLPNLRVLSLYYCSLLGPPDISLVRLKYLTEIDLRWNNFFAPFPEFFVQFASLKTLKLGNCELSGNLPERLFHLQSLEHLDVSANLHLQGTLPEFPQNMSLRTLILHMTNLSGKLPHSLGNLHQLSMLDLSDCNLTGAIPSSFENLTQLEHLDLSRNNLIGLLPNFSQLRHLRWIYLANNSLAGTITSSLFELPFLQELGLSFNQLSGMLLGFQNAISSPLRSIHLSSNKLEGPVPMSIYELQSLSVLELSFNNFSGVVNLTNLQRLKNLRVLDLSYNNLSIFPFKGKFSHLPSQITELRLAHCSLRGFPNFKDHSILSYLDISNNQIQGKIPNWIWNVGYVNLSLNSLINFEEPFPEQSLVNINLIDLHSNMLTGPLPIVPSLAIHIDYSFNNFSSTIPADIGNYLTNNYFFSLSHNKLTGNLPVSLCNASYLIVLDLSHNSLDGAIPPCLFNMSTDLGVLNLSGNKLNGHIPKNLPRDCALETLDLNNNRLEGQVPKTLASCTSLEVLNLGSNQINDTFPCWLKGLSNFRVLVLRSNKLYGPIRCSDSRDMWKSLQIFDLAYNFFSGELPSKYFLSWKTMSDANIREDSPLSFESFSIIKTYYLDKVAVISKGQQRELEKIQSIYTLIDLSCNMFQGGIPRKIGQLAALYILNISNNAFTGQIPLSIGNLKNLESLDLSQNKLTGSIPTELAGLTFLAYLNLSSNHLEGPIPRGTQIQSFPETSFHGNKDLCGLPLRVSCKDDGISRSPNSPTVEGKFSHSDVKIKWGQVLISAEVGFTLGLGVVIFPLLFCRRWRNYYSWQVDKVLIKVFGMHPPARKPCCKELKK